jgi:hypothetical protein
MLTVGRLARAVAFMTDIRNKHTANWRSSNIILTNLHYFNLKICKLQSSHYRICTPVAWNLVEDPPRSSQHSFMTAGQCRCHLSIGCSRCVFVCVNSQHHHSAVMQEHFYFVDTVLNVSALCTAFESGQNTWQLCDSLSHKMTILSCTDAWKLTGQCQRTLRTANDTCRRLT